MQRALWQIFLQFAVSKRGVTLIQAKHKKRTAMRSLDF
jgi:hypothetical protein